MAPSSEIIQAPLTRDELAERYRQLCDNPLFNNIPGKIEIDVWGRLLFLPFSTRRGLVVGNLCSILPPLGGKSFASVAVVTGTGVLAADAAWASEDFFRAHDYETPFTAAPEICVETVSSFNSTKELREKVDAYLAAGANEVWLMYLGSKRCEIRGKKGLMPRSEYAVDLSDLFS